MANEFSSTEGEREWYFSDAASSRSSFKRRLFPKGTLFVRADEGSESMLVSELHFWSERSSACAIQLGALPIDWHDVMSELFLRSTMFGFTDASRLKLKCPAECSMSSSRSTERPEKMQSSSSYFSENVSWLDDLWSNNGYSLCMGG
jgi:hypothetical protein